MNKQKTLWNKLARLNSKYVVASHKGKRISDYEFKKSGFEDYCKYILNDKYITLKGVVLDLGCGIGRITQFMVFDFEQVIGTDISGEMIRQAKEELYVYPNIALYETDGSTLPFEDKTIDFVFSYLVFQHIKDRKVVEKLFYEVYRVLKPKGLFKVNIRSDKVNMNKWWAGASYTEQSIGKLWKKVGFDLLKTEVIGKHGFWLWLKKV